MDMDCEYVITSIFVLNPVGRDYLRKYYDLERDMDIYPYKTVINVIVLLTLLFA